MLPLAQHLERALEMGKALADRRQRFAVAEVDVLTLVPARAHADHYAPAACRVDRRGELREEARVPIERARDDLPEADGRCLARERGERRPALEHHVRVAG